MKPRLGTGTLTLSSNFFRLKQVPWLSPTTLKLGGGYSASVGRNSKDIAKRVDEVRMKNWEECN